MSIFFFKCSFFSDNVGNALERLKDEVSKTWEKEMYSYFLYTVYLIKDFVKEEWQK